MEIIFFAGMRQVLIGTFSPKFGTLFSAGGSAYDWSETATSVLSGLFK
jgi:hypothetical protein